MYFSITPPYMGGGGRGSVSHRTWSTDQLDWPASEFLGFSCLCFPKLGLQMAHHLTPSVDSGDLNTGPHACPRSALPAEPPPGSWDFIF